MFVGHGLLAFAGVAGVASLLGCRREHALALGVCAGAFASAPDVDIVYAPIGSAEAALSGSNVVAGFWHSGNLVHRAVTHSLVVGSVASVAVGCWAVAARSRAKETDPERERRIPSGRTRETLAAIAALSLSGGLVVTAGLESGPLGAVVMALFTLTVLAISTGAARWGLVPREIALVALVGLCSHPFGDLFTGAPPAFLYPLDAQLVTHRIALSPDPTLDLLGAFAIELATFWLAAFVYASLSERSARNCIDWRAAAGIAYAGAALTIPAPTLESSYQFVVSVLAVGVVLGASPRPRWRPTSAVGSSSPSRRSNGSRRETVATVPKRVIETCSQSVLDDPFGAALTGIAAVTLALGAYAVTYVYAL